jgi:hypothetical protein
MNPWAEKLGLKDIVDERTRRGKLLKKKEGVASANLKMSIYTPLHLGAEVCGIPHLAKNERDVGHP